MPHMQCRTTSVFMYCQRVTAYCSTPWSRPWTYLAKSLHVSTSENASSAITWHHNSVPRGGNLHAAVPAGKLYHRLWRTFLDCQGCSLCIINTVHVSIAYSQQLSRLRTSSICVFYLCLKLVTQWRLVPVALFQNELFVFKTFKRNSHKYFPLRIRNMSVDRRAFKSFLPTS